MTTIQRTITLCTESKLAETLSEKLAEHQDNPKPVQNWNTEDVIAWLNRTDVVSSLVMRRMESRDVSIYAFKRNQSRITLPSSGRNQEA